jgi:hypothetical protein
VREAFLDTLLNRRDAQIYLEKQNLFIKVRLLNDGTVQMMPENAAPSNAQQGQWSDVGDLNRLLSRLPGVKPTSVYAREAINLYGVTGRLPLTPEQRGDSAAAAEVAYLQNLADEQFKRNQSTPPPTVTPTSPPVAQIEPEKPSRIDGVTAERVPYSEAALTQALRQAQTDNAASNTSVSLAYVVRDPRNGQLYVDSMEGITPTSARTLIDQLSQPQLNQPKQLAHPTDDVFRSNGIGAWPGGNPERDLKMREDNVYFAKLTPEQVLAAAQSGALRINGKTGVVLNPEAAEQVQQQILSQGVNVTERGNVTLAIQRTYEIPGPNGTPGPVRGLELFTDLTPNEARKVLEAAARDGSLWAPPGMNPSNWNLAQNGLSEAGLNAREKVLPQRSSLPPQPDNPANRPPLTPGPQQSQTPFVLPEEWKKAIEEAERARRLYYEQQKTTLPGGSIPQADEERRRGIMESLSSDLARMAFERATSPLSLVPPGGSVDLTPKLPAGQEAYWNQIWNGYKQNNPDKAAEIEQLLEHTPYSGALVLYVLSLNRDRSYLNPIAVAHYLALGSGAAPPGVGGSGEPPRSAYEQLIKAGAPISLDPTARLIADEIRLSGSLMSRDDALKVLGLPSLTELETDARLGSMYGEPLLTLPNGRPLPLSSRQAIENFFLAYADLDPATARRRAAEVPLVFYNGDGAARPLNRFTNGRDMFYGENRLFHSNAPLPEDLIGYNEDGSTKPGLYMVVGGGPSVPWSDMKRIEVDGKRRVAVFIVIAGNAESAGPNTFERGNPFSLLHSRPESVGGGPRFPFSPFENLAANGWSNIYGIDVKNPSDHSRLDVVHERADAEKIKQFIEWVVYEELFSAWLRDPGQKPLRDELSLMTDAERNERLSELRREFGDEVTVVLAGHSYGGTLALHAHHLLREVAPNLVGVVMPFGAALQGIPGCAVSTVGSCAGSDPKTGSFGFAPIEQNPFLEEVVASFMLDPGKRVLVFSAGDHDYVMGQGGSDGQMASFLPVERYPVDPTSVIWQFNVGSGPLAPDLLALSRAGPAWLQWKDSGVPPPDVFDSKFWIDNATAFLDVNRPGVDLRGGDAGGTGHMKIFENSAPLWAWLLENLDASRNDLSPGFEAARVFLDVRRHEAGSPLAAQTPPVTDQPPGPSGSTAGAQQSSESVRHQRELTRRGEGERLYKTLTQEQRDDVQQLLVRRLARGEPLDPLAAVQAVLAVAGARTESAAARQPPDPRQTPIGGPDPEPPPTPKGRADGWVEYHDLVGTQPELRSLLDQALDLLRQGQSVEVEVQEVGSMLAQGESIRKSRRFEGPDASSELVPFVLTAIESETQDVFRIKLTSDAGTQDVFANAIGPVPFLLHNTDRSVIDAQAVSDFMVRAFVMGVGRRVADTLLGMDGAQRTRVLARALDESGGASQRKSWITLLAALHAAPQPAALVERLDSPERFRIAVELIDYVKATLPAAADHRLIEGFLDLPPSEQERVFKALARIGLEEADRTEVAAPLIWGLAARAADPTIPAGSPVPDPQARLELVGTRYEIMTRAVTAWLDRRPDALDRTYPTRDAAALAAADLLGEFNRQQIQMGAEPGASAGRPVFEGLLIIYYDSASDTYLLSPPVVGNSKTVAHEQIAPGGRRAILRADDGAIDLTAGLALAGYVHSHPGREGEVGFSLGDLGAAGDLGGVAYVVETLPGVHAADATSSVLLKLDANARDVPLVTVVEEAGALPGFASQLPRGIRLRNEWD